MRQVKMALLVAKPKNEPNLTTILSPFLSLFEIPDFTFFHFACQELSWWDFLENFGHQKDSNFGKSFVLVKIILSMVNSTKWFQSRHIFIVMSFTKGDIETKLRNVSPRQVLRKVPVFGHPGAIEELLIDRICFYLPKGVWRIELELRQPDKCWWGYRFSDILAQ